MLALPLLILQVHYSSAGELSSTPPFCSGDLPSIWPALSTFLFNQPLTAIHWILQHKYSIHHSLQCHSVWYRCRMPCSLLFVAACRAVCYLLLFVAACHAVCYLLLFVAACRAVCYLFLFVAACRAVCYLLLHAVQFAICCYLLPQAVQFAICCFVL